MLQTKRSVLISTLLLVFTASSVFADPISSTEVGRKTMSKFMLNLAKFVTWPDATFGDEGAPYKYCILGEDSFGQVLESAMEGKTTKHRNFNLHRMAISDIEAVKDCHVVFINGDDVEALSPAIDQLKGLPILTVGELDNFAQYGGMIGFYGKGRRVALTINQKRLENAGLSASSKLYRASTM